MFLKKQFNKSYAVIYNAQLWSRKVEIIFSWTLLFNFPNLSKSFLNQNCSTNGSFFTSEKAPPKRQFFLLFLRKPNSQMNILEKNDLHKKFQIFYWFSKNLLSYQRVSTNFFLIRFSFDSHFSDSKESFQYEILFQTSMSSNFW